MGWSRSDVGRLSPIARSSRSVGSDLTLPSSAEHSLWRSGGLQEHGSFDAYRQQFVIARYGQGDSVITKELALYTWLSMKNVCLLSVVAEALRGLDLEKSGPFTTEDEGLRLPAWSGRRR